MLKWQAAAVLGFVAGFAERLVPNMMRWTAGQMEPSFGTPAQAVRNEQMQQDSHKIGESSEPRQTDDTTKNA